MSLSTTQEVGQRVRQLRQERGWSARRVAEETARGGYALSRGIIANIESGRKEGVDLREAHAFATAFGISLVELLDPFGELDGSEFERGRTRGWLDAINAIADLSQEKP